MTRPVRFRPSLAQTRRDNQSGMDAWQALYAPQAARVDLGAKAKRETSPRAAPGSDGRPLERDVLRAVLHLLRVHPLVAWRARINNGGVTDDHGQFVRFNHIAGCSDIIGQMRTGHFLAVECKRPGERPTEPQMLFLRMVQQHGGCAGWCDSVEGCERILGEWSARGA